MSLRSDSWVKEKILNVLIIQRSKDISYVGSLIRLNAADPDFKILFQIGNQRKSQRTKNTKVINIILIAQPRNLSDFVLAVTYLIIKGNTVLIQLIQSLDIAVFIPLPYVAR